MTCHVCKAQIASGSRFCSVCGSSTEPVVVSVPGAGARLESLLSEANLYRLRSQWMEAEKRCVDVMRVDSQNVHAHVLLGDIYRDQGKVDEARQWYQMAVDLEPDNRALNDKLRETRARPPRQAVSSSAAQMASASTALGTQNLMGLSPTNWFRVIWLFCGLFVVSIIGIVAWMRAHPRTVAFIPTGTIAGPPALPPAVTNIQPNGPPRTPGSSVTGTLPPAGPSSGTIKSPEPIVSGPAVSGPAGQAASPAAAAAREQSLTAQLSRPGALPAEVSVSGIRVDPRSPKVEVLLTQRMAPGVSEQDLRAAVARAGLAAAQNIFATDAATGTVTVGIHLAVGEAQPQPFFEADIDRDTAHRLDPSIRDEERFTNVWWATFPPTAPNTQPPAGG